MLQHEMSPQTENGRGGAPLPLPFSVCGLISCCNMVYQVCAAAAHVSRLVTTHKIIKYHCLPQKTGKTGSNYILGLTLEVTGHSSYTLNLLIYVCPHERITSGKSSTSHLIVLPSKPHV